MIGPIQTGTLQRSELSAVIHKGLSAKTADGKKARLAIIDEAGNVIEAGDQVAMEAFLVSIASYKNMLMGQGHLRVTSYDAQGKKIEPNALAQGPGGSSPGPAGATG
jgi:hypothetical protein